MVWLYFLVKLDVDDHDDELITAKITKLFLTYTKFIGTHIVIESTK